MGAKRAAGNYTHRKVQVTVPNIWGSGEEGDITTGVISDEPKERVGGREKSVACTAKWCWLELVMSGEGVRKYI